MVLDGQEIPDHRRAHPAVDRVRRGALGPGARRRDRADELRAHGEPHPEDGASDCRRPPTCSSWTPTTRRRSTPCGEELASRWGRLDGILHAIAFAPPGRPRRELPPHPVGVGRDRGRRRARTRSRRSPSGCSRCSRRTGGSIVSLDFDGQVAWPVYDWMGVAKAGLEAVTRYLARDLGPKGIRVNTVSAGPIRTMAGKGIPGFDRSPTGGARARRSGGTPPEPSLGRRHGHVPVLGSVPRDHRRADPRRRRVPRHGHRAARPASSEGPAPSRAACCSARIDRNASRRPARSIVPRVVRVDEVVGRVSGPHLRDLMPQPKID